MVINSNKVAKPHLVRLGFSEGYKLRIVVAWVILTMAVNSLYRKAMSLALSAKLLVRNVNVLFSSGA